MLSAPHSCSEAAFTVFSFFLLKEHFLLILAKNVSVKDAYKESSTTVMRLENKQEPFC